MDKEKKKSYRFGKEKVKIPLEMPSHQKNPQTVRTNKQFQINPTKQKQLRKVIAYKSNIKIAFKFME